MASRTGWSHSGATPGRMVEPLCQGLFMHSEEFREDIIGVSKIAANKCTQSRCFCSTPLVAIITTRIRGRTSLSPIPVISPSISPR